MILNEWIASFLTTIPSPRSLSGSKNRGFIRQLWACRLVRTPVVAPETAESKLPRPANLAVNKNKQNRK